MENTDDNTHGWWARRRATWRYFFSPHPTVPLVIPERINNSANLEMLLWEVTALHYRIQRRSPRHQPELHALLQGAVYAGIYDFDKGRKLYELAVQRLQETMQKANQIAFLGGALMGALMGISASLFAATFPATYLARWAVTANLAPVSTIASLCFFGLIGSLTSISLRLSKLDMRQDDSLIVVAITGMTQPFIALGFVSVVFVIIKYRVLGITITSGLTITAGEMDPVLWVAAFLCGFSERFAPAILDATADAMSGQKPDTHNESGK